MRIRGELLDDHDLSYPSKEIVDFGQDMVPQVAPSGQASALHPLLSCVCDVLLAPIS